MTVREALNLAINELKKANILTFGNDAIILVKTAIGKDEVFVLSNLRYELTQQQEKIFFDLLEKRKKRYPIAYITHVKEFFGFPFYVDERVLIPRPETETLVEETIKIARETSHKTIVDVGTGSGCVAITLSKTLKQKVLASDISQDALDVTKINKNRLSADVDLVLGDGINWLSGADIVVSNPPYVSEREYQSLSDDVKYEPKMALISDDDGLAFIKKLINEARERCNYLVVEFGYNQHAFIESQNNLMRIARDLSGIKRVAVFKFS